LGNHILAAFFYTAKAAGSHDSPKGNVLTRGVASRDRFGSFTLAFYEKPENEPQRCRDSRRENKQPRNVRGSIREVFSRSIRHPIQAFNLKA
jgi:hypothetical protein